MIGESFTLFAGVDWGSERHEAWLVDVQGPIVGERDVAHDGKGPAELCDRLLPICGAADTVAVGIEARSNVQLHRDWVAPSCEHVV